MDHRKEKLCNSAEEIRMTLERFFRPFLKVFQGKEIAAVIENRPWEVMIESRNVLDAFR